MPKVAIGIPVYNGANHLAAAINSIFAQSYGDFDLLISDNASTDGTEDICRAYAKQDRRIRYIRQPRNLGGAANFNLLAQLSERSYFKWAAHDDLLAPGFLAACVEVLDREPMVVLASPASIHIDETGAPLPYSPERGGMIDSMGGCWPVLPERNDRLMACDPTLRFEAVLFKMNMCLEIFGLMRRSALARTSLLGTFFGSDKVMLAQMSLLGPFWLGQETLAFRRCHTQQSSYSGSRPAWYAGRPHSIFTQQVKRLVAYCRALYTTELTMRQRATCLQAIARLAISKRQRRRQRSFGPAARLPPIAR